MALPKSVPMNVVLSTRMATWIRRQVPQANPLHLLAVRMTLGLVAALLMLPGSYATDNLGALLFVLTLLLRQSGRTLYNLLRETPGTAHVRLEHGVSSLILVLMLICIGLGQIDAVGAQAIGSALLSILFVLALRILLVYREEQQENRPIWQYSWKGYHAEDLLYALPVITLTTLTWLIPFATMAITPLLILWALYRIVLHN